MDTLQFNGKIHFTTLDSALICTKACGGSPLGAFSTVAPVVPVTPSAPGVPEPAAWTLMIGGFGLAGVSLRGRRGNAGAAA